MQKRTKLRKNAQKRTALSSHNILKKHQPQCRNFFVFLEAFCLVASLSNVGMSVELMLGITRKADNLPHVMKSLHFTGDNTIDHCTIVGYMANLRSGFFLLGFPVTPQTVAKLTSGFFIAMAYTIGPVRMFLDERARLAAVDR